jgi:hypothetical protein
MPTDDPTPDIIEATELIKVKMNKTVLEIATENAEEYTWLDDFPETVSLITLLDMAISRDQRWDVVSSTLERFSEAYKGTTMQMFPAVVKAGPKRRFIEDWFFQDLKRFTMMERLAARFVNYKDDNSIGSEYEAMQHWAKAFRSSDGWPDPRTDELLEGTTGLGGMDVIDSQYLLMRLGIRTLKPDNRLRLVFANLEIAFKDEIDLVLKGHELAEMVGVDPLVLDQLFW